MAAIPVVGNPSRSAGISMFVPLAGPAAWRYAHQVMFNRFGKGCFVSTDPTINNDCIVADNLAIRSERPSPEDLDPILILHLLDLVAMHSPNHQDCFMAAYYSYVLADFIKQNPAYFEEEDDNDHEEETKFAKLLKFGGDNVILALVIEAAAYLGHSTATTSNYFTLELIVSTARQISKGA